MKKMPNIKAISECLDDFIEKENKISLTPPEANEVLAKAGLLNDNTDRAGLPLRRLLRNKQLPQAYQLGGKYSRWVIPHSKKV